MICAAGCTGRGTVRFASLSIDEIDPPPVDIQRFDPQEAYWWTDDNGQLNIAMRFRRHSLLLGKWGNIELDMVLRPGPFPAGSGRNYRLHRRETRTLLTTGLQQQQFISFAGILDVLVDDPQTIHGSFRIWMNVRQPSIQLSLFPHPPGRVLCFGTFHAIKNKAAGQAMSHRLQPTGSAMSCGLQPARPL